MENTVIRLIWPIKYASEKEYILEFLHFVGCLTSDFTVEQDTETAWQKALAPVGGNEIDVVLNYYGQDPYAFVCENKMIRRLYSYFDFKEQVCAVLDEPRMYQEKNDGNASIRKLFLNTLIEKIWNPGEAEQLKKVHDVYFSQNLFLSLHVCRCLQVLKMGEVMKEKQAQVNKIQLTEYLKTTLLALWYAWGELNEPPESKNYYCLFSQVKIGCMIWRIVSSLYSDDYYEWTENEANKFKLIPVRDLEKKLQTIRYLKPKWITNYLLMASLCCLNQDRDGEEKYYLRAINMIPEEDGQSKAYAFIWFKLGYFYDKRMLEKEKALRCFKQANQLDPKYYPALFKLSYFLATKNRYGEAEETLGKMIRALFHNRSTEPNENGVNPNWDGLSIKDSQYVYKAYILMAKISMASGKEYSIKPYIGMACLAATQFENAKLVKDVWQQEADDPNSELTPYLHYHKYSVPVWAIWKVLEPWCVTVVQDDYVRHIVRVRLRELESR